MLLMDPKMDSNLLINYLLNYSIFSACLTLFCPVEWSPGIVVSDLSTV